MAKLFEPLKLGSLELKNRIVIGPMCQYSSEDGQASDWHMMHLGHLALSGAGLLIIEATAVTPEGRITPGDLGLYGEATEQALARVVRAIRKYSPIPLAIQLAHAGRKGASDEPWNGGQQIKKTDPRFYATFGPSAVPHGQSEDAPLALDAGGLEHIKRAFVEAALRSERLGLDGIEIHAAHGYLLHQFLSPISNVRTDQYGGSLENRMRFPLEVFRAVRAAYPANRPLWIRVSATDWVDGGWDLPSTIAFSKALKAEGCAAIHVSSGGVSPKQAIKLGPNYQVGFAHEIKKAVGLPTIAVGLITEPEQAEAILVNGEADAVCLARGMLYDPRWPWHAAAKLGESLEGPVQYWRSNPREVPNLFKGAKVGQR